VLLFEKKTFVGASGRTLDWKVECEALSDDTWHHIADICGPRLFPFGEVHGVPRGGLKLARALERYVTPGGSILLVDDVWTTGHSVVTFGRERGWQFGEYEVFVVFDRGGRGRTSVQSFWRLQLT
jgi:hypothetical protein